MAELAQTINLSKLISISNNTSTNTSTIPLNNTTPLENVSYTGALTDKIDVSKLNEIQKMVITENFHKWINIGTGNNSDTYTVCNIEHLLATQKIKPRKVVIGGCNTAGCVISTKGFSAAAWANKGYDTTIFLPMCADYQQPGVDPYEKSIAAFTLLYNRIKHLKLIDKIDIQSNFEMIY